MTVPISEEQFATVSGDVQICYQTFGESGGDPLVLVMGLGGPMIWWDSELCIALAERGFHVVRYDNRDTGRSSRLAHRADRGDLVRAFVGLPTQPPYQLSDMADDAFALMDHLGWESAHVAGVSMGGMIVQTMAVEHPERVRSLTSISSTLGRRTVGYQHPRLLPMLIAPRAAGKEAYIRSSEKVWAVIGSPGYPSDKQERMDRAAETFDRGVSASGVMRQMAAILAQPDRTRSLRRLRMPAAVIHGTRDKMVHVSGGRATARAIPDAELVLIDGLGHDLPSQLYGTFADVIRRTADRAEVSDGSTAAAG